jgi:hypothetical protein
MNAAFRAGLMQPCWQRSMSTAGVAALKSTGAAQAPEIIGPSEQPNLRLFFGQALGQIRLASGRGSDVRTGRGW